MVPPKMAAAATRFVAPASMPAATAINTIRRNPWDGMGHLSFRRRVAGHFVDHSGIEEKMLLD